MEQLAAGWPAAIEASALGAALKQSAFLYPLVNVLHVLGIALLFGAIVALDLRLLGFGRRIPADAAETYLRTVGVAGLAIAAPAGVLLFVADAVSLAGSTVFAVKLVFVGLAVANAILFVVLWRGRMTDWDERPPLTGRVQAMASLFLWGGAVCSGRLIAYL